MNHHSLAGPPPESTRIGYVSDFAYNGTKLEGEGQGRREVGESPAGGGEDVGGWPEPGDPNGSDLSRTGSEDVEESRPLEALHDVKVDDVDGVLAVEGLEDRLVGGEV